MAITRSLDRPQEARVAVVELAVPNGDSYGRVGYRLTEASLDQFGNKIRLFMRDEDKLIYKREPNGKVSSSAPEQGRLEESSFSLGSSMTIRLDDGQVRTSAPLTELIVVNYRRNPRRWIEDLQRGKDYHEVTTIADELTFASYSYRVTAEGFEDRFLNSERIMLGVGRGDEGWKVHLRPGRYQYLPFSKSVIPVLNGYWLDYGYQGFQVKFAGMDDYFELADATSQQVCKFITIYVPKEIEHIIPALVRDIDAVTGSNVAVYHDLLAQEGDPRAMFKEEVLGKTKIASIRWSSDFSGRDKDEDKRERTTDAAHIIAEDTERLRSFMKILVGLARQSG